MSDESTKNEPDPDLQGHYDFTGGVRGKYAERCRAGTNIIVLEPDVFEAFPDSESVNRALRALRDAFDAVNSPGKTAS